MDVLTYDIPVTVSQIRKTLLRKEKTGRVGKKVRIRGSERKNEKKRVGKGRKSSRYAVILPAKRQS